MSDARRAETVAWRGPAAAWAMMMVALVSLVALGVVAPTDWRFVGAMTLAAATLLTLAFGLVGLAREPALVRLTAGAASMFLALMALLSFADVLTRPG